MLMAGLDNRSAKIDAYLRGIANGLSSHAAWQQVFGADDILRELKHYVQQDVMKAVLYRFDREIPKVAADTRKVGESETQAGLADLLRRVAPREEASARFDKALAIEPRSARLHALAGLHALDHGDSGKARAMLTEALRDRGDWLVQYHIATGLTDLAAEDGNRDGPTVEKARGALDVVLTARPELPNAHALSARLDSMGEGDLARGLDSIRRARTLAPGRPDYALLEAFILMRRSSFTEAKLLLGPLVGPAYPTSVRDRARSMLGQVARLEANAAAYRARLEGRKPDPAPESAATADDEPRLVRNYRKTGEGETRVEGQLARIDCLPTVVTLELRVDGGIERFTSRQLNSIEFIVYGSDAPSEITCGPRKPPEQVYLTWKSEGTARRVVAIEFR
jgi:hypothetical protein